MSQYFTIHPDNPEPRLIRRSVEMIREGGVVVYPTNSGYALGCQLGNKGAIERIWRIRDLNAKHHFTLVCRDLSQVGTFSNFDTPAYRLVRANTPGPYTFILRGTREVPRRLMHPKRKTLGLRIPENRIAQALLAELHEPMLTTTLIMPGDKLPMTDPLEIRTRLEKQVDLVIDGGYAGGEPTTMVDLTGDTPRVLREGRGDAAQFS
ncbi:MAG: L-threonylcarbamoyladenylate synthase [Candidatus Latescibacteria bacterium]|jgi:tRNA threonylcarbamoyl adenosine modification protein (Sua5/YciO/YrdC/YwlC family)|nr:L-threonylcarbamoyladenylate synthase [Candidatus Latescibacterota bacterium]